jgi:hypothetical protein
LKIEQLLVQYLYNNKQVSLQGIGIFKLKPDVMLPSEGDKDFSIPADAFSFEYNLKATEDEGLVNYIVQQTRKIKPLASSDLDSYAILAKQFLNIGKPLVIDGVGTIQKNQQGQYDFIPGQLVSPKMDDSPVLLRERKEEIVSFESENTGGNNGSKLKIIITIALIILTGLVLYYFLVVNKPVVSDRVQQTDAPTDSLKNTSLNTISPATDTTTNKGIDTINNVAATALQPINIDNSSFKIILKEYNSQHAAQVAYDRLTSYGHKLEIIKVDSAKYKLAVPFTLPLSDTLRVRDSLKVFFGGKPYVQL